jgi:hypothetical protein
MSRQTPPTGIAPGADPGPDPRFHRHIPLDDAVLHEAEAIVPHVRSLDAIHLGSALRSGLDDLVIVTHDSAVATVAATLGLRVLDPVIDREE